MSHKRTDLAIEAKELWSESAEDQTKLEGVDADEYTQDGCAVTRVKILTDAGSQSLGKPIGTYTTVNLPEFDGQEDTFDRAVHAISTELSAILNLQDGQSVLVVGLGNRSITPDSVGPHTLENTMVTRHLVEHMPEQFSSFRRVSAISPDVLGNTGVESARKSFWAWPKRQSPTAS